MCPIEEGAGHHRLVPRLIVVFQRQLGVVDVRFQHVDIGKMLGILMRNCCAEYGEEF